MPLWKIAWRSIQQRSFASFLTGLSMALGVAVMIAVLVVNSIAVKQFEQNPEGFHLVVGAKGGKYELVLNTVYYLSQPVENIPYAFYQEFTQGQFADFTEVAVPLCLGDSYRANDNTFRIVATNATLFDKMPRGNNSAGELVYYKFAQGRNFHDENYFEAVIGSIVAKLSGLKVGDTFHATHGIDGDVHAKNAFTVVGVLAPSETSNDRALFINMEGFYLLEDHALSKEQAERRRRAMEAELGKPLSDTSNAEKKTATDKNATSLDESLREVTAVLVRVSQPLFTSQVQDMINEGHIAQAISPVRVVTTLLDQFIGPLHIVLLVLTILIVIVASISILVSIYNSMSERSRDIAVMRALGARRWDVMAIVLSESILLSVGGGIAGIVLGHGLVAIASPFVEARTGISLHFLQFDPWELIIIPSLVILASLVGLLPAFTAYRTDVAKSL